MSSKSWQVCEVECVAGFRIIPEESERAVAIAIQRDPNAHGLDGISADEALRHAHLIAAAPELLEALKGLLDDVQGLMSESEGVAGLHRNGDVADWASLDEGGRFERLSNMSAAIAAIAKATGAA